MRRLSVTFVLVLSACGTRPGATEGGSDGTAGGSSGGATSATTSGSSGAASTGDGSGGQTGGTSSGGESTGAPGSTGGSSSSGGESTGAPGSTGGSSGGGLCDGFEEPGCVHKGCPMGQVCDTKLECVPSTCSCDPQTGDVVCTADCGGGTCVMQGDCPPVPCDLFCEFGFEEDMNGCELCECAPAPDCGCQSDADCVKASPGCCSCAMGGKEVAVAAACVDTLEECPLPPDQVACPAVYLCTDAQAVCVQGACVLQQ